MPQRSNQFQRLIRTIYDQLMPCGATLTESAMIGDGQAATKREIDILLEVAVAGSQLRLAVECRDHRRPADVSFIDALIGKYRGLPIDRVIAVSRSGFTAAAERKAKSSNIDVKTLREALEADWPAELSREKIYSITLFVDIQVMEIESDPAWDDSLELSTVLVNGSDVAFEDFVTAMRPALYDRVIPYVSAARDNEIVYLIDFGRPHVFKVTVKTDGIVFCAGDVRRRVNELVCHADVRLERGELPTSWQMFGSVGVTTARDEHSSIGAVTIVAVQRPGGERQSAAVLVESVTDWSVSGSSNKDTTDSVVAPIMPTPRCYVTSIAHSCCDDASDDSDRARSTGNSGS